MKIITFSSTTTRRWHLEMIKWKFLSGGVACVVMPAIVSRGNVSLYSDPVCRLLQSIMSAVHYGISYLDTSSLLFVQCAVISDQMVDAVDTLLHETQCVRCVSVCCIRKSWKTESTSNQPPTLYQHCWGYLETWKWEYLTFYVWAGDFWLMVNLLWGYPSYQSGVFTGEINF